VDYANNSTANDMAAVVAFLFGHLDGMERMVGNPGVGDALALAAPRLCFRGLTQGQRMTEFSGAE
jgi:hypothetical protein